MKALSAAALPLLLLGGAVNQEKALVGAFSLIVKTDGSFAALKYTETFWFVQPAAAGAAPVFISQSPDQCQH